MLTRLSVAGHEPGEKCIVPLKPGSAGGGGASPPSQAARKKQKSIRTRNLITDTRIVQIGSTRCNASGNYARNYILRARVTE
jgi:hypothetical protein